jgi:preprotein translocase subunit SecA
MSNEENIASKVHKKTAIPTGVTLRVTQQAQQMKSAVESKHVTTEAHVLSANFSEQVSAPKLGKSLTNLPELPHSKNSVSFLDQLRPLSFLKNLLRHARGSTTAQTITQAQLRQLLEYAQYNHGRILIKQPERNKCATLSFRILGYLAEHQWRLPSEAIQILLNELSLDLGTHRFKNLPYVLLALGHAINNGQTQLPEQAEKLFLRGIKALHTLRPTEYYHEVMAVVLLAKTKLPKPQLLSADDLSVLENALFAINISSGYKTRTIVEYPAKGPGLSSFKGTVGELKAIKGHVKLKYRLSEVQQRYTLHRAEEKALEENARVKTFQIIRHAVINKQRYFPEKNTLWKVLQEALEDKEFKIRTNALMTVKALLQKQALGQISTFKKPIAHALHRQQLHALKALINHLNLPNSSVLAMEERWCESLKQLADSECAEDAVRYKAHGLWVHLTGDVYHLLKQPFCIGEMAAYLAAVQHDHPLPPHLLSAIEEIATHQERNDKTVYQALLILRQAAENGQKLSPAIIHYLIQQSLNNPDSNTKKLLLSLLGFSAHHHNELIGTLPLLEQLAAHLANPKLVKAICFFTSSLIDSLQDINQQPYAAHFMHHLLELLIKTPENSDAIRKNLLLIFGKAAEKGMMFPRSFIETLFINLTKDHQHWSHPYFMKIVGVTLKHHSSLLLSESLLDYLLSACQSNTEIIEEDALRVFSDYLQIAEAPLTDNMMQRIFELLSNDEFKSTAIQLIQSMVKRKWPLSDNFIEMLAEELSRYSELNRHVVKLLEAILEFQPLPEYALDKIMEGVYKQDEKVSKKCLSILQKNILNMTSPVVIAAMPQPHLLEEQDIIAVPAHLVVNPTQLLVRDTAEKSYKTLLDEMRLSKINKNNPALMRLLQGDRVKNMIEKGESSFQNLLQVPLLSGFERSSPIYAWTESDIQDWERHIKKSNLNIIDHDDLLSEFLAVLIRVCILTFGYSPHRTQLLAVVLILRCTTNKENIFAQITMGEGKSLITAMLARARSLYDEKTVDAATSSAPLATRDAKSFSNFYATWGDLTVDSNEDKHYKKGLKPAYKNPIVCGSADNFQFDILRDQYRGLGTRGDRGFDTLIIDEVDNFTIDENTKFAMLAESMPHMDALTPLMMLIWKELNNLDHDVTKNIDPLIRRAVIQESLLAFVDKLLEGKEQCMKIPNHLTEFVTHQKNAWVQSAICALYDCFEKKHYTIEEHEGKKIIAPTNLDTGVRQRGTSWSRGLQQMVQIKEGLPVTTLNITTNFSTKMGLYKKYREGVIGMSGTLGSPAFQTLLKKAFEAELIEIPTFMPSRLTILPGKVCEDKKNWSKEVRRTAIQEAEKGRVSLIVCETIEAAEEMNDLLKKENAFTGKRFLYVDDQSSQGDFLNYPLDGNTIIISTPLAGRGVHPKLNNNVVAHGGIHAIMTFLSESSRGDTQVYGRGGSCGEPGTAQSIVNKEDVINSFALSDDELNQIDGSFDSFAKLRDKKEEDALSYMEEHELPLINKMNTLFENYLELIKVLDDHDRGLSQKSWAKKFYQAKFIEAKRAALEEQWGLWFESRDLETKSEAEVLVEFQLFKSTAISDYKNDTIIKNPAYYIRLGNSLLHKANSLLQKPWARYLYEKAIEAYKKAVAQDEIFSYNAFYHMAYAIIKLKGPHYKKEAKNILTKAYTVLSNGVQRQDLELYSSLKNKTEKSASDMVLMRQLEQRLTAYQTLLNSMTQSIVQIEQAQRPIELQWLQEGIVVERNERLGKTRALKELTRRNAQITPDNKNLQIVFRHFKTNKDGTTNSQLENTIDKLPDNVSMTISFDSEKLGGALACKALLPINRPSKYNQEEPAAQPAADNSGNAVEEQPIEEQAAETQSITAQAAEENAEEKRKTVGTLETLERWAQAADKAFSKMGDFLCNGTKRTAEKGRKLLDRMKHNEQYEEILISLTAKTLTLTQALSLLPQIENQLEQTVDLHLIEINKTSLMKVMEKTHNIVLKGPDGKLSHSPFSIDSIQQNGTLILKSLSIQQAGELLKDLVAIKKEQPAEDAMVRQPQATLFISKISQKCADTILTDIKTPVELAFVTENKKEAYGLLNLAIEQHHQAVLTIGNISNEEGKVVLEAADRLKQDLTLRYKPIQKELMNISQSKDFQEDFLRNGYFYLYETLEKNPLPWKSLVFLTTLCLLETAACLAIAGFTAGAGINFALAFGGEALGDLLRIVTTLSTREFELSTYIWQKALSVALSFSMAGFSYMSAVQHTAHATQHTTKTLIAASSDDIALLNVKAIVRALKKFGFDAAEAIVTEASQKSLTAVRNKIVSSTRSKVEKHLKDEVSVLFDRPALTAGLNLLFACDHHLGLNTHQTLFFKKVEALILDKQSGLHGFSSLSQQEREKFYENLIQILDDYNKEFLTFSKILTHRTEIPSGKIEDICTWLKLHGLLKEDGSIDMVRFVNHYLRTPKNHETEWQLKDDDYNIKSYQLDNLNCPQDLMPYKKLVIKYYLSYAKSLKTDYFLEREDFLKQIADFSSNNIVNEFERIAMLSQAALINAVSFGAKQGGNKLLKLTEHAGARVIITPGDDTPAPDGEATPPDVDSTHIHGHDSQKVGPIVAPSTVLKNLTTSLQKDKPPVPTNIPSHSVHTGHHWKPIVYDIGRLAMANGLNAWSYRCQIKFQNFLVDAQKELSNIECITAKSNIDYYKKRLQASATMIRYVIATFMTLDIAYFNKSINIHFKTEEEYVKYLLNKTEIIFLKSIKQLMLGYKRALSLLREMGVTINDKNVKTLLKGAFINYFNLKKEELNMSAEKKINIITTITSGLTAIPEGLRGFLDSPNFGIIMEHWGDKDLDPATRALKSGKLSEDGYLGVQAFNTILTAFRINAETQQKMLDIANSIAQRASDAVAAFGKQNSEAMAQNQQIQKTAVELFSKYLAETMEVASLMRDRAATRIKELKDEIEKIKAEAKELIRDKTLDKEDLAFSKEIIMDDLKSLRARIEKLEIAEFAPQDEFIGKQFMISAEAMHAELMKLLSQQAEGLKELQIHLVNAQKEISAGINGFMTIMQENNRGMLSELIQGVISINTMVKENKLKDKNPDASPPTTKFFEGASKQSSEIRGTNPENNSEPDVINSQQKEKALPTPAA